MYYVAKKIRTKEYELSKGEVISLPITLALPCDLINMDVDNETRMEKYEIVLKKEFNKSNDCFNTSVPIYDDRDKCINSEIVDSIYEGEEELKRLCYEANMRMLLVQTLGNRDYYNDLREQYHNEINSYYDQLESKVLVKK